MVWRWVCMQVHHYTVQVALCAMPQWWLQNSTKLWLFSDKANPPGTTLHILHCYIQYWMYALESLTWCDAMEQEGLMRRAILQVYHCHHWLPYSHTSGQVRRLQESQLKVGFLARYQHQELPHSHMLGHMAVGHIHIQWATMLWGTLPPLATKFIHGGAHGTRTHGIQIMEHMAVGHLRTTICHIHIHMSIDRSTGWQSGQMKFIMVMHATVQWKQLQCRPHWF